MKKKLNSSDITNELSEYSSFFKNKDKQKELKKDMATERPNVVTNDRTVERDNNINEVTTEVIKTENITIKQPAEKIKKVVLLEEVIKNLTQPSQKKPTERYSFEIFTELKDRLEDVQYLYKKRTGNKITNSRIIREALEIYLEELEKQLSKKNDN